MLQRRVTMDHADGSFRHHSDSTSDLTEVIRLFLNDWGLQKLPDWAGWPIGVSKIVDSLIIPSFPNPGMLHSRFQERKYPAN
ncbi:hypothetical protein [Paenibacillus eucommiae]|uniref:Uncharacterized protein n=1 Tax=Paenibacillus eucommiae TaxID=1355755 RepID=A0ABS4J7E3_9BACL|nr:hypothetical protein [Paenibacillus eucommiae]MBP1994694.1 hypothetical protein [Paenibacillus eucommiae]